MKTKSLDSVVALVMLAAIAGCSHGPRVDPAKETAGADERSPSDEARELIRRTSEIRSVSSMIRGGAHLGRAGEGYKPSDPIGALQATLPRNAGGPMHLQLRDNPNFWADIVADEVVNVRGEVAEGTVVYRSARPGTHLIRLLLENAAEELRVLDGPWSSAALRYVVHLGPAVRSVEKVGREVHLMDAHGTSLIAMAGIFAIDAAGTRRDVDVRLATRGDVLFIEGELATDGLLYPIAIDPIWRLSQSMHSPRMNHAAAALDGSVVVAGGASAPGNSEARADAERWNSGIDAWIEAGSMQTPRQFHTLTPTSKGALLAAGGQVDDEHVHRTTDVFSPPATWTPGPELAAARAHHTASSLSGGRIVVAGGSTSGYAFLQTTELYDPTANAWSPAGNIRVGRMLHAAVTLPGDRVLIAGGMDENGIPLDSVELWDGNRWLTGPSMSHPRFSHTATVLPQGRVLVTGGRAGGDDAGILNVAEVYDPVTGTWRDVPIPMISKRTDHAAVLLDSRVLIAGGVTGEGWTSSTEIYDPVSNVFRPSEPLIRPTRSMTLTSLGGHRALVAGGVANSSRLTADTQVFDPGDDGASCTANTQCFSGVCTDGVCCDSACTGQCAACDQAGALGKCSPLTGEAPHGSRSSCGTYLCFAGACASECANDAMCVADHYCSAERRCVPKQGPPFHCTRDGECLTGHCADGVCCESACTGQCETCAVAGAEGRCLPVVGAPPSGRAACGGNGSDGCALQCTPASRTACTHPSGNACGTQGCAAGVEIRVGSCNGMGVCDALQTPCGLYQCANAACKQRCEDQSDCTDAALCEAGLCVLKPGKGAPCGGATCAEGLTCVDGLCCTADHCPSGESCAGETHRGECSRIRGQRCEDKDQCGSGFCVDGLCCERACEGQCETCGALGNEGICTLLAAQQNPVAPRAKCAVDDPSNPCSMRVCDGVERSRCAALTATLVCAEPSCSDALGQQTTRSTCQAGVCAKPEPTTCAGYRCEGQSCKTSCSSAADCAPGFRCNGAHACESAPVCQGSIVTQAGLATIDCGRFRCEPSGVCKTKCDATSDCTDGYACNHAHACVELYAAAPIDTGCACSALRATPTPTSGPLVVSGFLLASLATARLARRSRVRRPS